MADIEVIFDPVKEYAAIVNIDTRRSWGPAMVGPQAGNILQTWVDTMPFDVTYLHEAEATTVFLIWLEDVVKGATEEAPTAPVGPVEPLDGDGLVQAAQAEDEAVAAGGQPPDAGPADTDMAPDASQAPAVVTCPLCTGAGVTSDGADGASVTCAMCGGAKAVRMQVPS